MITYVSVKDEVTTMKEPLIVKEFESITSEAQDKTKYGDHCIPEGTFEELKSFIYEFDTENSSQADVLDFMKIGVKRNAGDVISVKNYVGLIQLKSGYQVQILPKIDFADGDSGDKETKKVFLKMLRSMKDFKGKLFNAANLQAEKMNLYEIFINMYIQEARRLVKRGIKSDYVRQEDNLNCFKGKLLVNQHIRANMVHKERFYVAFDEFNQNRAENRLVKATLEKLQKITNSAENSKEIRQLLTAFEMVESSKNYAKDFSKVVINRNTEDYENLMHWSKVFLFNKSFSTFSGASNSRALLFPMEKVYEDYVAFHMKKIFGKEGWKVSTQDKGYYLFEEPKKRFRLRPDIVIKKDKRTIILDTKWKKLIKDPGNNFGISQADMYQMYAYSKKYNTEEVWLLYPMNSEMRGYPPISYYSGDNTYVRIFFVDVAKIEKSLHELKMRIEEEPVNQVSKAFIM